MTLLTRVGLDSMANQYTAETLEILAARLQELKMFTERNKFTLCDVVRALKITNYKATKLMERMTDSEKVTVTKKKNGNGPPINVYTPRLMGSRARESWRKRSNAQLGIQEAVCNL